MKLVKIAGEDGVQDIARTLVDVADALDEKGATEEAALADSLLQEIPQTFLVEEEVAEVVTPAEAPRVETKVETEAPKVAVPETEVEAPKAEAPKAEAPKTEGTPFSELKDEKKEKRETPVNPDIKGTKEAAPEMDEVSLKDFESIIQGMKLRISQGPKRKVYEQVLERARKAEEYKKAYEEWLGYAHRLLDDNKEPIRIKL